MTAFAILSVVVAGSVCVITAGSGARQRSAAASRVALAGVSLRESNPELSLLLGATAIRLDPDPLVKAALMDGIMATRQQQLAGSVDIWAAALSADGRLAFTSDNGRGVRVRPLPDRRSVRDEVYMPASFLLKDAAAGEVALSLDGKVALIDTANVWDPPVEIWDLTKPKKPRHSATFEGGQPEGDVESLTITPDGRTALVNRTDSETDVGHVLVLDITDRSHPVKVASLSSKKTGSGRLGVDATDKVAVIVGKDGAVVWDITDPSKPKETASIRRPGTAEWRSVALGPEGDVMVVGTGDGAVVWDLPNGGDPVQRGAFSQGTGPVDMMSAVSDRHTVLIRQGIYSVALWEITDPSHPFKVAQLGGVDSFARSVALSRNGMTAFVGVNQGSGVWWNLAEVSGDPLRDLCRGGAAPSGFILDKDKWDRYVGEGWADHFGDRTFFQPCSDPL
ncbi:WD40 repeat domain-containing protein [Streptosporangium sp. NPDC020145]|uniref:WD40 repeat domain-containing protein n=1 Tax=Streptosporangium sp. NPDC020145 TaxID=3154694 RepID=UPI0034253609